jgi:hypothetical protein
MDNQAETRYPGRISLPHMAILQNKLCVNSNCRRLQSVIYLILHLPSPDLLQKKQQLEQVKLSSSAIKLPRPFAYLRLRLASVCEKPDRVCASTFGTDDGGEPVVEVVTLRPGGAVGGVEVQQLLLYPLPR